MQNTYQCPCCENSTAQLVTEPENAMHKGKSVLFQHSFYRCPTCQLEFDSEETLDDALNQVYKQGEIT